MSKARKDVRVPKRLAGVKIPKALRHDLRSLGKNEEGRARIRAALLAATTGVAAKDAPKAPVTPKARPPRTRKPKASSPPGATAKPVPSVPADDPGA